MRALIAMPSLRRGGAERHAVYLATAAAAAGHEVDVVSLQGGGLTGELDAAGIPTRVLDLPGGARAVPQITTALAAVIAETQPDVISAHDVNVELGLRGALLRRAVPTLVWKHTYGHIGHRGLRDRVVERASGRLITRYGAVCHTQVRYLTGTLGIPSSKISVLPNTVAPCPEGPWPQGPLTVAMVAAMRPDKGHADALAAWERVLRSRPDARLLLAGDGPHLAWVRDEVSRRGLGDNVELLGEVADPMELLARSQALLLASYNIECFPYVALEAMSMGRPVISTDVGGLPEMVEDRVTGVLVPPRDPAALGDAVLSVADDAILRRMGAAGRERLARCFPMEDWSRRAVDLLADVHLDKEGCR
ncbi:glycosyltransferase family 4 protein [Arsenicicoccus dermatophilus]|uniref:glycosyltransferase family 4 protein n=1 Tax=Arsenicicoccus dermatophilus TaxID=1076331 RepID=UPI00391763B2